MRAQVITATLSATERMQSAVSGLIIFDETADSPTAWREPLPKLSWVRSEGEWTLPRADVCAMAIPWSIWDPAAAQLVVGTFTLSVRKLAQLLRVGIAKLSLRGDGSQAAREVG
eukprot:5260110-Pleurochrysis_carterae.AAC.1